MKKNLKMKEKLSCDFFPLYRREYIKKWIEIHSNDQKKRISSNKLFTKFFFKKKKLMFFSPLG